MYEKNENHIRKYGRLQAIKKLLRENPKGLTISEIASRISVNRSTIHRELSTLEDTGNLLWENAEGRLGIFDKETQSINQIHDYDESVQRWRRDKLKKLTVTNYRSLAQVEMGMSNVNLLFGPNGSGKTTFLDAIWFVRDCAIRGVDVAASDRSHGIGVLWDRAKAGSHIKIEIETNSATYAVQFGFSSGRIEPFVGERLTSKDDGSLLIDRRMGSDKVQFYKANVDQLVTIELREPNKLALSRYLDFENDAYGAVEVDSLLKCTRNYHARSTDLYQLKTHGSASETTTRLYERCENLWSVLRNLRDEREINDPRYDIILGYMRQAFPTFDKLYLEQQGANSVYGSFIESDHREPIRASGVSDGHLQLLTHLTALFSETKPTLILFDEPEVSLHPYAISIFAKAVEDAARNWNKQIFIATHSPVLISQFGTESIIAVEIGTDGQTLMQRVNQLEEIQDLLDEYAVGSLYMAELIAPQSKLAI